MIAAVGLVAGSVLGLVGSFVPTDSMRGLAWGLDGTFLVVAVAALTVLALRAGEDLSACGFLVFTVGQGLVLASVPMSLADGSALMVTGAVLWAGGLAIVSLGRGMPMFVRATGLIACAMFLVFAVQGLTGSQVDALSKPLPFFAYPFLALTLFGWAWRTLKLAQN